MIVKIDSSVGDALADDANSFVLYALEDLCRLRMNGYAVIDISKRLANQFRESTRLSELQRRIFTNISTEVTFQSEILSAVNERVVLYHDAIVDKLVAENVILSIDISSYSPTAKNQIFLTTPFLILENHSDQAVYKKVADWKLSQTEGLAHLEINFEAINGGGDNSAEVCKHHHSNGELVFSICDSDRKSPHCNIGATARKLKEFFKSNNIENSFYLIDAHEVENLLPLGLLRKTANQSQMSTIEFLDHITMNLPHSYLYYDLKNGFNYDFVYIKSDKRSIFWRELYESYGCVKFASAKAEFASDASKHTNNFFCRLSSMLPHARRNLTDYDVQTEELDFLENEWNKIGKWMLSLFISYPAIQV